MGSAGISNWHAVPKLRKPCKGINAHKTDRCRCRVRVQGGGALTAVPLPAHKLTPHDVVELRPAKGDASQPAIASGIVHRRVAVPLNGNQHDGHAFIWAFSECELSRI